MGAKGEITPDKGELKVPSKHGTLSATTRNYDQVVQYFKTYNSQEITEGYEDEILTNPITIIQSSAPYFVRPMRLEMKRSTTERKIIGRQTMYAVAIAALLLSFTCAN